MPRRSREKSGTGVYHVMMRGINRQDIFEDDEDYQKMVGLLRGLVEHFDENGVRLKPRCTMYGYCLMSNHLHLLLQEREESVSDLVKHIGIPYAHYFNSKYERNGHLFQDRFRSEVVGTMEYFVTLLRYIHQNPVKAGIAEGVSSYPWSSWTEYASVENGFCSVRNVFTRVSKDNLLEMISTPIEDCDGILDIDTAGSRRVSDDEVRAFLLQRQGIQNPLMVQSLEKWRRNEVLKSAKQMGAGARQLARLTGISFGVIQKL